MKYYPLDKCFVCGEEFQSKELLACGRVECGKEYTVVNDDCIYFHVIRGEKYYQLWITSDGGVEIFRNDYPNTTVVYVSDTILEMTYEEWVKLVDRVEQLSSFR